MILPRCSSRPTFDRLDGRGSIPLAPSWQGESSRTQHWSVQPCVRPLSAVHMTAGHNALRGSGPNQKHAFKDALTQTGSPDPRIDLVCITSSCPRQFLQSFSSQVGSGFTSLVALAFNATTIALRCCGAGAVHSIRSGHRKQSARCPLCLRKRTLLSATAMYAMC
jgi:hypothetical protein